MTPTITAHNTRRIADLVAECDTLQEQLDASIADRAALTEMAATYWQERDDLRVQVQSLQEQVDNLRCDLVRTEACVDAQACVIESMIHTTKGDTDNV